MVIGFKRIVHKLVKKCARANFVLTSTTNIVKEANDHFHNNFGTRFKAHSLRYTCVNLGFTTLVQQIARQQAKER